MNPTILTSRGVYFDFTRPYLSAFPIDEIAHALANLCRFSGHTRDFYSVAQHCVLVSHVVPPHHALEGLLHDAHEAYLGDVVAPLKAMLPQYRELENQAARALRLKYSLPVDTSAPVKHADLVLLKTEQRDLMRSDDPWPIVAGLTALPEQIKPWSPATARDMFIARYRDVVKIPQVLMVRPADLPEDARRAPA